jgi:hypothetical protein
LNSPIPSHVHDSFDAFPENRDAFWEMLVQHNDKVRGVFVSHTHYYSRMRVKNPSSVGDTGYPDQTGGIYQIDGGTTGKEGMPNTVVEIQVQGTNLTFRAIQASDAVASFEMIDQWQLERDLDDSTAPWTFAFIGDNRNSFDSFTRNLHEIQDMTANPDPTFTRPEFVIDGGDMDPVQENYENAYLGVFGMQ